MLDIWLAPVGDDGPKREREHDPHLPTDRVTAIWRAKHRRLGIHLPAALHCAAADSLCGPPLGSSEEPGSGEWIAHHTTANTFYSLQLWTSGCQTFGYGFTMTNQVGNSPPTTNYASNWTFVGAVHDAVAAASGRADYIGHA